MFKKLLIANRGEIACRVIATAERMGIATVAVYSDADREALHVRRADEARCVGPAAAAESYLNVETVLAAAKETGADAIHPGYGFLAENAEFADAVRAAGITFVGPPTDAIRAMGAKDAAKALMEAAGVPVIPGYKGDAQETETLALEAVKIGFPVLLKAAYGGGGKGMRVAEGQDGLIDAIDGAKRESLAAFGDDTLLIEKFLTGTRHVEVQVFADSLGNAIHLFERDCSLQRRHQKVIEEAPAPDFTEEQRQAMGEAAVAAARAVDYEGAGTVEFLLESNGGFYFLEMNTRLQVEHPVTEMITGQDLVEWQLRVAAGEPLPLGQDGLAIRGHAMEARLYAEDPQNGFLPAPGRIHHLRFPAGTHVRIDSGIEAGDDITPYYDPMIAKVSAWGEDRAAALSALSAALGGTEVAGPVVNRDFLLRLLARDEVRNGAVHVRFIEDLGEDAWAAGPPDRKAVLAAIHHVMGERRAENQERAKRLGDGQSPWNRTDGWRLQGHAPQDVSLIIGEQAHDFAVHGGSLEGEVAAMNDAAAAVLPTPTPLGDWPASVSVVAVRDDLSIFTPHLTVRLQVAGTGHEATAGTADGTLFDAPMPGKVVAVNVAPGAVVEEGDLLVVLEAMKMEHALRAPADGTVTEVFFKAGDQVAEGAVLLNFEPLS